jgi:hypothetical protein
MDRACGKHGELLLHTTILLEHINRRGHLDETMILK